MTDWTLVRDSRTDVPPEWDKESSPTTIYQRKDIKQIIVEDEHGEHTEWQYEQRTMGIKEYLNIQDGVIEQQRADLDYLAMETGVEL